MKNIKELYEDLEFDGIFFVRYEKEEFFRGKDKIFPLGKISMLVYKYLALLMHKDKTIEIFDKISKYDENLPAHLRIYDLVLQISGISELSETIDLPSNSVNIMKIIIENKFKIFDTYWYGRPGGVISTTNFIILTYVLELAAKKNIKDLMKEYIIDGMKLKNCKMLDDIPHGCDVAMDYETLYDFVSKMKNINKLLYKVVDEKDILVKNAAIVGFIDDDYVVYDDSTKAGGSALMFDIRPFIKYYYLIWKSKKNCLDKRNARQR